MKSFKSEISYKFLVFLLLSLLIFFVISKVIYQFITYKKDIDLTKERLENIITKEKGSFLNNLNYPIYSFINPNYIDNQIKQIIPYQLFKIVYLDYEKSQFKDIPENFITFDLKNNNDFNIFKELKIIKGELISNLKIYNDGREYKITINCGNLKSENIVFIYGIEKFNILNDYNQRSFFYLYNGNKIKRVFDHTLNLRLKKYKNFLLITTEIAKPGEVVYFIKDFELNIRFFYNPKSISDLEIEEFINNLKRQKNLKVEDIKIKKDNILVRLFNNYYMCIKNINLSFEDINTNKITLLLNKFEYEITGDKVRIILKNLKNKYKNEDYKKLLKEIVLVEDKILLPLYFKDFENSNILYFTVLNYFGNEKIKDFLKYLNDLKRETSNKKDEKKTKEKIIKITEFLKNLENKGYKLNNFLIEKINKNLNNNYDKELLNLINKKEEILDNISYLNFLNPKIEYLNLNKTLKENIFTVSETKIIKEEDKEKFLKLLKNSINEFKKELKVNKTKLEKLKKTIEKDKTGKDLIKNNLKETKENPYFNLILIDKNELMNYLIDKEVKIKYNKQKLERITNNIYFEGKIKEMKLKNNKLIIKVS